ncbi:MAG: divergent polysaccharide deacetylase family protein [Candidatus Omnitrophica bacterium]|nr:divergent polysaccharide deacetylase family protein [Candidatus Omnitrophota bacterium]
MKKYQIYRNATLILSFVVIIETMILIQVWFTRPRKRLAPVPPVVKGKIAIVIDDWGYNLNHFRMLEEIGYPLTISVLPNLSCSSWIAQQANRMGLEVILHLPLEPYERYNLESDTITTSMDEVTIKGIIEKALADIPTAKGVSNHMGSKATADFRVMEIVFRELKRRNLYFLDSLVSPKSICFDVARKVRLNFAQRDVFLDNQEDTDYIKGQIDKLKTIAKVHGQVIGIGHVRKNTLDVLKEMMPLLAKQGYKFVFVSELAR